MKKFLLFIFLSQISLNSFAQFPPPAGVEGTTAIHQDSAVFVAWAKSCQIQRGYLDIALPNSGYVSMGEAENANEQADQTIVSLGDGGIAILEFENPIINGPGADFATYDSQLNIINDPYSTPFPSGDFDLDAVGIIHQATSTQELSPQEQQILVYPCLAGRQACSFPACLA